MCVTSSEKLGQVPQSELAYPSFSSPQGFLIVTCVHILSTFYVEALNWLKSFSFGIYIWLILITSWVAQMEKNLPAMQETWVPSLGLEDSPGEGHGNPLQYSRLENPMDRGTWQATIHGVAKSQARLSG